MAHAFTSEYNNISNRLMNTATVTYNGQSISTKTLWDTGATITCVSYNLVNQLSMISTGKQPMLSTSGRVDANTYLVDINLPNDILVPGVKVCDSRIADQGFDLLIGMDIISQGDFSVSNYNGKTIFTFRMPSVKRTDYVKEIAVSNTIGKSHSRYKGRKR